MAHEFSFEFDRRFVRDGLKRDFAWRSLRSLGIYALMLLVIGLVMPGGSHPTFFAVGTAGFAVIGLAMWRRFGRAVDMTYDLMTKQSPDRRMTFRLSDDAIEVDLGNSQSRYPWDGLRRLWRYPDVWLLEVLRDRSVLFPVGAAPDAAREFVVERCRSAGIRV